MQPAAAPAPAVDPTAVQPAAAAAPAASLPAGLAPEDVAPSRPSFRDRGRLRRRLRYLRRVRELGFRDLGGLAFDLHRFRRRNDELVLGKLAALDAVDRELRAIERVLNERRDIIELREPGVAACPRCGALHGSDANFCPQCGTQFSGPRAIGEVGGAPPTPEVSPAQEALPISASEQGSTPVSGALAGNPPPEVPEVPAAGAGMAGDASSSNGVANGATTEGSGEASGQASAGSDTPASGQASAASVTPASADAPAARTTPASRDTPAGGDAASGPPAGANGAPGEAAQPGGDQPTQAFPALGENGSVTSGDPLASRERSAE